MILFASQGYAQTSVADIQRACGLAPNSGALYKHFASKRELLEAATNRYVERLGADRTRFDTESTSSIDEALHFITRLVWDNIDDNAPLLRVIFREPAFPDLANQLWSAVTTNAYRRFAEVLHAATDAGAARIVDPDAAATVLLSSLVHYPMVQLLIGHMPGGIDKERYRAAWIEHTRAITQAWPSVSEARSG